MTLADLLRETIDLPDNDVWENERIPTPVRVFGVRLHSMGPSVREVSAVLELLGVDRSHGVVWNWTHDLAEAQAEPSRVAVDEKQIELDGEKVVVRRELTRKIKYFIAISSIDAANVSVR